MPRLTAGSGRVLVDSSVWSLAFRRGGPSSHPAVGRLRALIEAQELVVLVGIILTEVLQGFRSEQTFERYERGLRSFPLLTLVRSDYASAAALRRRCREKGVAVSTADSIIAAAAINHGCAVLSADDDFAHIARHSPLVLL